MDTLTYDYKDIRASESMHRSRYASEQLAPFLTRVSYVYELKCFASENKYRGGLCSITALGENLRGGAWDHAQGGTPLNRFSTFPEFVLAEEKNAQPLGVSFNLCKWIKDVSVLYLYEKNLFILEQFSQTFQRMSSKIHAVSRGPQLLKYSLWLKTSFCSEDKDTQQASGTEF